MKKVFFFFLLCCASFGYAQTVQVSVNLKNLANAASVSNTRVCFSLVDTNQAPINNPRTTSGVLVPNQTQCFAPDGTGLVSTPIVANDQINPPNTMYLVDYQQGGQSITSSCYFFNLADTTENLNTKTSGCIPSSSLPAISTPVLTNPLQTQTITQPSNTNFNVTLAGTGSMTISGGQGLNIAGSTFTGQWGVANGGTGASTFTVGAPLYYNGSVLTNGAANANGVAYSTGTTVTTTPAGGAGTLVLRETGGGAPSFGPVTGSMFSGQLGVPNGGTGVSTFTTNGILYGNGTGAVQASSAGGAGTLALCETNGGTPFFSNCTSSGTGTPLISNTANPASSGAIRLANSDIFKFRNATNTGDITALQMRSNAVVIGDGSGVIGVTLQNASQNYAIRNNANTTELRAMGVDPGDILSFGTDFNGINIDGGGYIANQVGGTNSASAGFLRLFNGNQICWRNNANTADICDSTNTSDIRFIGGSAGIGLAGPIKDQAGTATMGCTEKDGSAGGNYSIVSATYADMQTGTELQFTTTVPTGWKAKIDATWSGLESVAGGTGFVAITDGTTVLKEIPNQVANTIPSALNKLFAGDGASHTFKLRFRSDGVNTFTISNGTSTSSPTMIVCLFPSN